MSAAGTVGLRRASFAYFAAGSEGKKGAEPVARVALQYNPAVLERRIVPAPERRDAVIETLAFEIVLDASDALEAADATAERHGVRPRMEALEELLVETRGTPGTLVFEWAADRVLPVALVAMTVRETLFDETLQPLRVTLALELEVLRKGPFAERLADIKTKLGTLALGRRGQAPIRATPAPRAPSR